MTGRAKYDGPGGRRVLANVSRRNGEGRQGWRKDIKPSVEIDWDYRIKRLHEIFAELDSAGSQMQIDSQNGHAAGRSNLVGGHTRSGSQEPLAADQPKRKRGKKRA